MKTLSKKIISATVYVLNLMVFQSFGNQPPEQISKLEITITPNEQSTAEASMHNPIILKKARTYHAVKEMQDSYIGKHYENYQIVGNGLTINNLGHFVQSYMLKNNEDGKIVHIYFDVNDICRKYKKLDDKNLRERVEYLLKSRVTGKTREVKLDPEDLPKWES